MVAVTKTVHCPEAPRWRVQHISLSGSGSLFNSTEFATIGTDLLWYSTAGLCSPTPNGSLEVQLSVLHTNYECPSLSPQGCDVDLSLPFNKNRDPIRWPPLLLLGCVTWVMFLIITHFRFFNPSAILFLFMHYNAHLIIFAHNLAINIWRSAGVLTVIMPSCWDPSTTI